MWVNESPGAETFKPNNLRFYCHQINRKIIRHFPIMTRKGIIAMNLKLGRITTRDRSRTPY
jgi:hypothetical protein